MEGSDTYVVTELLSEQLSIPALKTDSEKVADNKIRPKCFLDLFFPKMTGASEMIPPPLPEEIAWKSLTELEIYQSLKAAKETAAPGEDEIPTLVWKRLWTNFRTLITYIFTKSVELRYLPNQWKQSQIVVLQKPDKSDYMVWRISPISLLNIVGKYRRLS